MTIKPATLKAIVFDFDGTLARLNIDFSAIRCSLLKLMSLYRISKEGLESLFILEMIKAGEIRLSERHPGEAIRFRDAAYALVMQGEIEAAQQGDLFEDTRMLLAELGHRSIRTGVVTRNCRTAVLQVFPDIDRYCQIFLAREDTDRVKPHPDHLLKALIALGAPPAEAAVVGDHPMDIHLGKEAGTYTIGVLTGHSGRETLLHAQADLVIDKASYILDFIS